MTDTSKLTPGNIAKEVIGTMARRLGGAAMREMGTMTAEGLAASAGNMLALSGRDVIVLRDAETHSVVIVLRGAGADELAELVVREKNKRRARAGGRR